MGDISVNLSCPSCGGAIAVEEGARLTNCKYCDALLSLEGEGGVFKTTYKNNVSDQQATQVLKNWFSHGLKARDLPQKASLTELYPIYLPFWRYNARAAGWVCGYEERRKTDSQGRTTVERINMERMVFRDFDWTQIACDTGDLGIRTLKNIRGEAVLHDDGSIPIYEATTSSTDAQNQGEQSVRNMARASAGVPHITFEKIHVIPRMLVLTHYPVWIGRYEYAGRSYFATVDGVTGTTLSGRAPGDPLYQSAIMTGGALGGGLVAGLGISVVGGEVGWAMLAVGVVIFVLSYLFFRHGSEILEGDMKKDYLGGGLGDIAQNIQGAMK
jgi:hypothetical protein